MELMHDMSTIGLLATILSLCSWIVFEKGKLGKLFFALFGISITSFILSQAIGIEFTPLVMMKQLFVIAGFGGFFLAIRSNYWIASLALIFLYSSSPLLLDYFKTELSPPKKGINKPLELSQTGELFIELRDGMKLSSLDDLLNRYDLTISKAFDYEDIALADLNQFYTIDVPDHIPVSEVENVLRADQAVEYYEQNEILRLEPTKTSPQKKTIVKPSVNDPAVQYQWGYTPLDMNGYYAFLKDNKIKAKKKASLFILDSGIEAAHEDLTKNYKSFDTKYDTDANGHGTHCAGIAAAVTNNKVGIASFVPNQKYVELSSLRVINGMGFATQKVVINGILAAVDAGADVISLSLGGRSSTTRQKAYNEAMKYANANGSIVVVAAGNSSMKATSYSPANSKGVITVAAVDSVLNRTSFSNTLEGIEYGVAAPGLNIHSTFIGNSYKSLSGTSMAAPHVSGLVAMMKSIKPDISLEEAYTLLSNSGKQTTDSERTGKVIQPKETMKRLIESLQS